MNPCHKKPYRKKPRLHKNPLLTGNTEEEKKNQFLVLLLEYHKIAKKHGKKLNVEVFLRELRALAIQN